MSHRIVIDARLRPGTAGGVQMVLEGLFNGLDSVEAPDVDLIILGWDDARGWLESVRPRRSVLSTVPAPDRTPVRRARRALGRTLGGARTTVKGVLDRRGWVPPTTPDPAVEGLVPDLVHFPFQAASMTTAPFIYQPHDLQHVHLPQAFTQGEVERREASYGYWCRAAERVVVASSWVRSDVCEHYGLTANKVEVIPLAPLARSSATRVQRKPFALYPAAAWPHKNHERLLDAMARLVDEGIDVELVLTGADTGDPHAVRRWIKDRNLTERVHVLGFVSDQELAGLYEAARCLVMPSLFEAASFPVWEAMHHGVPVIASNVTSLPKQVGDAGLLVDPLDVGALAQAWRRVWIDPDLRSTLVDRGRTSVARFDWTTTARRYLAVYRDVLGSAGAEDRALLSEEAAL